MERAKLLSSSLVEGGPERGGRRKQLWKIEEAGLKSLERLDQEESEKHRKAAEENAKKEDEYQRRQARIGDQEETKQTGIRERWQKVVRGEEGV